MKTPLSTTIALLIFATCGLIMCYCAAKILALSIVDYRLRECSATCAPRYVDACDLVDVRCGLERY